MKKKKYLSLYYEWMETGYMSNGGLCNIFNGDNLFELCKPTEDDLNSLYMEDLPSLFWGKGKWGVSHGCFTPLRQNIVLLMAAMNGEL